MKRKKETKRKKKPRKLRADTVRKIHLKMGKVASKVFTNVYVFQCYRGVLYPSCRRMARWKEKLLQLPRRRQGESISSLPIFAPLTAVHFQLS